MTALADALRAAQAQTLAAMQRAYLAGLIDDDQVRDTLEAIGCTDAVEQSHLLAALEALRGFGVQGQAGTPPNGSQGVSEAATDAQWKLLRRLSDDKGRVAPDGPLTKTEASELINALKGS